MRCSLKGFDARLLLAVSARSCFRVNDAIAGATVRPHPQQHVLTRGVCLHLVAKLIRRGDRFAVHFKDHIAAGQAGIFSRAARLYLRHRDALYIGAQLQLLAHVRGEIGDRDP